MSSKCLLEKIVGACIFSECADGFDHARIVITRALAKRIIQLHKGLLRLKANYIHEYDYTPELLMTDYEGEEEKLVESDTSVDCEQLVVSQYNFCWQGQLKHSSTPTYWETDSIPIEELEVLLIPPQDLPKYLNHEWKNEETRALYLKRLSTESKVAD